MQASTAHKQAVSTDELVGGLAAFLHYVFKTCGPKGGMLEVIDELGLSLTQLKAVQLVARLTEIRFSQLGEFVDTLTPRERSKLAAALAVLAERDEIAALLPQKETP